MPTLPATAATPPPTKHADLAAAAAASASLADDLLVQEETPRRAWMRKAATPPPNIIPTVTAPQPDGAAAPSGAAAMTADDAAADDDLASLEAELGIASPPRNEAPPPDAPAEQAPPTKGRRKAPRSAPTAPADTFKVPRVGRGLGGGRGLAVGTRLVAALTVLVVSCGLVGVGAYLAGVASRGAAGALTPASAAAWHIDTYNVDSAVSFGTRYLRLCLARANTGEADRARQKTTATYTAGSPDPACGDGNGNATPLTVTSINYAGLATPITDAPNGRYLAFDTALSDGRLLRVVVPIYLADPATGSGPRIIGTIGLMSVPTMGQPTGAPTEQPRTDMTLGGTFQQGFLADFMGAWAASGSTLAQYLAPNATEAARGGLYGYLGVAKVTGVTVLPPADAAASGGTFTYKDGMVVEADITATFSSPTGQWVPYAATYRAKLLHQGGHWFVADIAGGLGNLATSDMNAPTPTYAPSPTPKPTPAPTSPAAAPPAATPTP